MTPYLPAALAVLLAGATDLKRGDPAPPLVLEAVDGRAVDTGRLKDQVLLLLFVDAGHEKCAVACREIEAALNTPRLAGQPIQWILVLSKSSPPDFLGPEAREARLPPTVVHDGARTAFGAYRIVVVPSAVVVGRDGRVVHVMAGHTNRFGDIVYDALSVAAGKLSLERFEQTLHPTPETSSDEQRRRAARLAMLADQLARRDLDQLAESKYLEALELDPRLVPARLALGDLLMRQNRLDEAEARFREAMAMEPSSASAALGLAQAFALRGGEGLDEAERLVGEALQRKPDSARAHFLMGLIHERRGDLPRAAASYRKAAELLLRQAGPQEPLVEEEPGP